jgi:hypothetical protein
MAGEGRTITAESGSKFHIGLPRYIICHAKPTAADVQASSFGDPERLKSRPGSRRRRKPAKTSAQRQRRFRRWWSASRIFDASKLLRTTSGFPARQRVHQSRSSPELVEVAILNAPPDTIWAIAYAKTLAGHNLLIWRSRDRSPAP